MKTTLDLPDELLRSVKIRAARDGRKLKDVIAELIRSGLSQSSQTSSVRRTKVRLPLIECSHEARPEEEITPERVAEILSHEETKAAGY